MGKALEIMTNSKESTLNMVLYHPNRPKMVGYELLTYTNPNHWVIYIMAAAVWGASGIYMSNMVLKKMRAAGAASQKKTQVGKKDKKE
jgi:hypothetical protein